MFPVLGRRLSAAGKVFPGNGAVFAATKSAFYSVITTETNPTKHTVKDLGLFYPIDNSLALNTFNLKEVLNKDYVEECKTFDNTYIMIRKPAMEIINYLKHTNFDCPVNRYVLYGKHNHGKTITMSHLLHFAYASEWLVIYFPDLVGWLTKKTERVESSTKKGVLDLPVLGSDWLHNFKCINLNVINKLDLKIQNDYSWNIQEENHKGESLLSIVDHGIARGKYSCDVICAVLDEVVSMSKMGIVKTLVLIDDFSVVFHPGRKSSNRKYKYLHPYQLSILESFKNLVKPNWHNGAVVLSCQSERNLCSDTDHLPLNKLTLKGLEFLDPFIPVEVPKLTDLEMTNILNFYRSMNWLQKSGGDDEIKALSAGCIATMRNLCGPI